jgi:hypothetical protein
VKFNPRQPLQPLLAAVEALPERDRAVLLVAGLLLVAAAEWFLVWPMHQQRGSIVTAAVEESQAASDASAQLATERQQRDTELQGRARALEADLALLGMNRPSGQPLGELVAQALKPQAVRVAGLRELDVEEMQVEPAAGTGHSGTETTAEPDAAAAAPQPGSGAAAASLVLYRHRFELRLRGDVPALLAAATALEQQARPLRIERMRMASADGVGVELTLTLAVLGTERAWLAL